MPSIALCGYTNPTLMWATLDRLDVEWLRSGAKPPRWPEHGLTRIQWMGPWSKPAVPKQVAYRHTHWVGARRHEGTVAIFDVNAMGNGSGWLSLGDWAQLLLVPFILKTREPQAAQRWHSRSHSTALQGQQSRWTTQRRTAARERATTTPKRRAH